jgi:hypothetical protein
MVVENAPPRWVSALAVASRRDLRELNGEMACLWRAVENSHLPFDDAYVPCAA